jgi:hypothetical protein
LATNGRGWQSLEAADHKSVLSHPGDFPYDCRVKVSQDGATLRIYTRLGPDLVKAIFLDSRGNITSEGHGKTIKEAARDAGATGVL